MNTQEKTKYFKWNKKEQNKCKLYAKKFKKKHRSN